MVMTPDHVALIGELLFGCGPGEDRAARTAIAVGVLRNQDFDTTRILASYYLGACATLLTLATGGDPVEYRLKVSQILGAM